MFTKYLATYLEHVFFCAVILKPVDEADSMQKVAITGH